MKRSLLTLSALAIAVPAFAQLPPPPPVRAGAAAVRAAGTALIVGEVVDAATGRGVGGAIVTMAAGGLPGPERVMTDADGTFVYRSVPPGSFQFSVQKGGYLDGAYGRRRPSGPSAPLVIAEGERRSAVTILIFRPSAITGGVTDEAGEPLVGVDVRAYRRSFSAGRAKFSLMTSAQTDDRGHFRLSRLLPGDYIVVVPMTQTSVPSGVVTFDLQQARERLTELQAKGLASQDAVVGGARGGSGTGPALPPSEDGKPLAYPTTFYPASGVPGQATLLTLASGEERPGVELQLRPSKTSRITGSVHTSVGAAPNLQLRLVSIGGEDMTTDLDTATAFTDAGGRFVMPSVPTGHYVLRALQMPRGFIKTSIEAPKELVGVVTIISADSDEAAQWAAMPVTIGETDVTDLIVMLRPGLRVSGRIEFEGSAALPDVAQLGRLPIVVEQADGRYQGASTPPGRVDPATKTFSSMGVIPGKYFIRLGSAPSGWALKSVMYQSRDVSETPFELEGSDASGIVITFTDQPTLLSGGVRDSSGNPDDAAAVLVFPADPQSWVDFGANPRGLKNLRADAGGHFQTRGLPAGDYLVVAVKDEAASDWLNPVFLQAAARVATKVRIGNGESHALDLKTTEIR